MGSDPHEAGGATEDSSPSPHTSEGPPLGESCTQPVPAPSTWVSLGRCALLIPLSVPQLSRINRELQSRRACTPGLYEGGYELALLKFFEQIPQKNLPV